MNKLNFSKIWTTEYSLFSVWLFGREYTESCKKEIGKSFKNIIFSSEGNLVTVYRAEEDTREFSRFLAGKMIGDASFRKKILERNKKLSQEICKTSRLAPKDFLKIENFNHFINIHNQFLPYFLTVLWSPNEFKSIKASEIKKNKIFKICANMRHETEHIYPNIEKYLHKIFQYIGKKEKVDWNLLRSILPDEFEKYIKGGRLPSASILEKRYKNSVILSDAKRSVLITGEKAKNFINKLSSDESGDIKELKGTIANRGVATGRVSIIFSGEDRKKLKKGDILVTTMTRPEWLSAMKIASAYVTDAGGILCHAAIVSRELNKPCIIGTKIATKVLKDGDLVEVDANKGVVRIIKK